MVSAEQPEFSGMTPGGTRKIPLEEVHQGLGTSVDLSLLRKKVTFTRSNSSPVTQTQGPSLAGARGGKALGQFMQSVAPRAAEPHEVLGNLLIHSPTPPSPWLSLPTTDCDIYRD